MVGPVIYPPKFEGEFGAWKRKMTVFFSTDYELLLTMKNGFSVPIDGDNKVKEADFWTKKEQADAIANGKAEFHLLTVLPEQDVNRIGKYNSAKELWEKFLELHEGTSEAKLARRDILRSKLTNLRMEDGQSVAQLHAKVKELITSLENLGEKVTNRDAQRYALNAFPRTSDWTSIIDAYYISKDLEGRAGEQTMSR
ncbi:uncharacterized protein LOC141812726 [Curcuma longa]|uniref:uncharacterized protein LOC141812726 n=1 Tax=Curcuma longa TaxID=136217 RepID=UPI003D9F01AE